MKTLQQLIQELCPNGVEFKKLKDVSIMKRGSSVTKKTITVGDIPVISGGVKPAFYCNSSNRNGETITVAGSGAGAGLVLFWNEPIFVCDAFSVQGKDGMRTKFIYYVMKNMQERIQFTKKGAGVPHVHIHDIEDFEFPVPPLPVQEKIVEILDNFTALTAELQAELQARQLQYEYYRDRLLSFGALDNIHSLDTDRNDRVVDDSSDEDNRIIPPPHCKLLKMSEIAQVQRGASPRPIINFIDKTGSGIPWIKIGDIKPGAKYVESTAQRITPEGAKKSRLLHKGDFILSNSMSFGRPYILKIDGCIHDGWAAISNISKKVLPTFLFYILNSKSIQSYWKSIVNTGSVSNLNTELINNTEIPVPSIAEQKRIVEILDRFETLTNDIQNGLPAEIEARQQQYEYYRNKLLTFKKLGA